MSVEFGADVLLSLSSVVALPVLLAQPVRMSDRIRMHA